jgi:propionyl-CoA carboxylase alpha chain
MEAMKMEHVISAPTTGTVTAILVTTGQQVDNGAVLLTLESDDAHHDEEDS